MLRSVLMIVLLAFMSVTAFAQSISETEKTEFQRIITAQISAFRADAARAGANVEIEPLVTELCARSPEFAAMWRDNDVRSYGEGVKNIRHPILGRVAFEYSSFAVDGRADLTMVVYNPATPEDTARVRTLLA